MPGFFVPALSLPALTPKGTTVSEQFFDALWLNMAESCAYTGLCDRTLRQAVRDGRLVAYRTSASKPRSPYRFKRADLDAMIAQGRVEPKEMPTS